jgi:hypothetical protein
VTEGWVYVSNDGGGVPKVLRSDPAPVYAAQHQPGEYIVTFPAVFKNLACVATLNNSAGFITVIPGDRSGLAHNQVRVLTMNLGGQLVSNLDFTLEVACCEAQSES